MYYRLNINKRTSDGQKAEFIFNRIIKIASEKRSVKKIIQPYADKFLDSNKSWENQLEYFQQFEDFEKECPTTIVLDEADKSLDIITVSMLYREIFPRIVDKTGCQIITVSHNPLILSNKISGNKDNYNLISMDEDYTEKARKTIQELFE